MNTYLVPTTAAYCYEPYDYIYLVYANSSQEAYEIACKQLKGEYIPQKLQEYKNYSYELYKPDDTDTFPFHKSKKYDILKKAFSITKGLEYMGHFQVNWKEYTSDLALKANKED